MVRTAQTRLQVEEADLTIEEPDLTIGDTITSTQMTTNDNHVVGTEQTTASNIIAWKSRNLMV
jgi:hypothetical protein